MRLKNLDEVNGFINAVEKCKGDVYLYSPSGDRLNLKSLFSRYISIGRLIAEEGDQLELFCNLRSDEANFFDFFMAYPNAS